MVGGEPGRVDEQAFSAVYAATAKPLWRYIARLSGRQEIADELLQECYFRLLRSERADLEPSDARPYLFRIATNLLHDLHRKGTELSLDDIASLLLKHVATLQWTLPACCAVSSRELASFSGWRTWKE